MTPTSPANAATREATRAAKIRKLETAESLAMLTEPLTGPRSDAASVVGSSVVAANDPPPLAIRVTIKHGRLVLLTAAAVVAIVALTLCFSRAGVVVETYERRAVSITDQEKLLEKYNSYSGTVTALLERPVEMYMTLIVPVVMLRVMAQHTAMMETRWRLVCLAAGTIGTFLLANAFSAVNVQVRELPVRSVISAGELTAPTVDPTTTSTMDRSYAETDAGNPVTNTILRNLILPRAIEARQPCRDLDVMDAVDIVDHRIPQRSWMKYLLPRAVEPTSLTLVISATNAPANAALSPEQLPMNASVAAELLVASYANSDAWGTSSYNFDRDLATQFFRKDTTNTEYPLYGSAARLAGFLPPKQDTTEREDREWLLTKSGPVVYNFTNADLKNASLQSWTMTFSRVDIVPGVVWVDAVTVERVMATPRLQTNTSTDGTTRYLALNPFNRQLSPNHVSLRKASSAKDEAIDMFGVCTDRNGVESLTASMDEGGVEKPQVECPTVSKQSLLFMSRGKRLVADAWIENATVADGEIVRGDDYYGVVVNLREVFSTTVARISWNVQNLSAIFHAECGVGAGCMGFDVPLTGSGQHLVVNASSLPVAVAPPLIYERAGRVNPLTILSVRRPQSYSAYRSTAGAEFIGDILMPHNIRDWTKRAAPPSDCDTAAKGRMVAYVNNHVYMESTLQTTYMAAAFFLFQAGVTRDILADSSTTTTNQTLLAFDANTQDVDVYIYIPWLNVVLTLVGCGLLVLTTAVIVLWPLVCGSRSGHGTDPLDHITEPHTIANVLLNDNAFPPLLMSRAVADAHETETDSRDNADKFVITNLDLSRAQG